MIQYALKCQDGHRFDSWFKSAAAYEALEKSGHLSCAICGDSRVSKAVMAPSVSGSTRSDAAVPSLKAPQNEAERLLEGLRKHIEANADYVGGRFADEARAMYLGASPERAIYGEANRAEAKALIEDGVPIAPLPFLPNRKSN